MLLAQTPAQAQKVRSTPFSYLPEEGPDRYDQRVPQKTLPLPGGGFVILAHQSAGGYAVERYDAGLKKQWTALVPVKAGETVEAFSQGPAQAWVVVHHQDEGSQRLIVYPVGLSGGQRGTPQTIIIAGPRDRRPGVSVSPDGSRLLAFQYLRRDEQIKSMLATLFDQNLGKLVERTYEFGDQREFFTPGVLVANDGTQYVTLVGAGMKQLSVRRYAASASDNTIKVLSAPLTRTAEGRAAIVRDAKFTLLPEGGVAAAALVGDYETGEYTSLQLLRFDFSGAGSLRPAPEVKFDPAYLARLSQAGIPGSTRLEDLYLAELLHTPDQQLVVIAERHFEEGGDASPVHARELHLFGYDQNDKPTWQTLLAKDQLAPPVDAYTGIGFRAAAFPGEVQLLTLETLNKKSDLYRRRLDARTGTLGAPERLKLNVADDQQLSYVKDFTAWLGPQTIIGVSRPSKKSAALRLDEVELK